MSIQRQTASGGGGFVERHQTPERAAVAIPPYFGKDSPSKHPKLTRNKKTGHYTSQLPSCCMQTSTLLISYLMNLWNPAVAPRNVWHLQDLFCGAWKSKKHTSSKDPLWRGGTWALQRLSNCGFQAPLTSMKEGKQQQKHNSALWQWVWLLRKKIVSVFLCTQPALKKISVEQHLHWSAKFGKSEAGSASWYPWYHTSDQAWSLQNFAAL